MKRPPGLVGSFGLLSDHGKLHIADPQRLDWHHGRITTYCGRTWAIPQRTHTWGDADEVDLCKSCIRAAQLSESVAHEAHKRFWARLWKR